MSERYIPEHIDPYRFAEQSLQLHGLVRITDMPRLGMSLTSNEGTVGVELKFGKDEQGLTYLKGKIQAKLTLQCQRCMEPMLYEIISDFALGIVTTLDEANALPSHYEPVLTKEGMLALRELIEDELILNLPIIPKHEAADICNIQLPKAEADERENPFHVLQALKGQKK
jgi:uncharacterized protein